MGRPPLKLSAAEREARRRAQYRSAKERERAARRAEGYVDLSGVWVTQDQRRSISRKAGRLGLSVGQLVVRAVVAYSQPGRTDR